MMVEEIACNNRDGPNQVLPAEDYKTSKADGLVKIRIPETGTSLETAAPLSVPGLLNSIANSHGDHPALCSRKADGTWSTITYREYENLVRTCAKAFLKLGLERHHTVCIMGFNSAEWFISDLGAIYAGGMAAGIYTTNSPEACYNCLESSRANIIVLEDEIQLKKILQIRDRLPKLKAIVQYTGTPTEPGVISWSELIELGKKESDANLEEVLKSLAPNECCTLVYTSGTVGNPKAVMLSHDNVIWDALVISQRLHINKPGEVFISYLPLSHIAAQLVDIYLAITIVCTIYFADKDALKGSLLNTLLAVQPTRFLAVPRVWEKIHEKMMQVASKNGPIKSAVASWAKHHGLQHYLDKMNGVDSNTWGYSIASSVIFKKIKKALGLNRCLTVASAAAPISADIKKYFMSIDIPIMEAFGMSEASGAHTLGTVNAFGFDTVGLALSGAKTKIINPDEKGHGEICMKGRHVFMGYLNDPEKTADAVDDEGWLHSGDIGYVDEKGLIYVTGRLKELLITAGGENIPPVPIESIVKANLPHISNAFLIGDRKKFLSILLTLKTEVDVDTGMPKDALTDGCKQWLESLGCPANTVQEVLSDGPNPKLIADIQNGIDRTNEQATSNAQKIQKFVILPQDFSIPTGELGPTLKVKRNVVVDKYSEIIEKLYQ